MKQLQTINIQTDSTLCFVSCMCLFLAAPTHIDF